MIDFYSWQTRLKLKRRLYYFKRMRDMNEPVAKKTHIYTSIHKTHINSMKLLEAFHVPLAKQINQPEMYTACMSHLHMFNNNILCFRIQLRFLLRQFHQFIWRSILEIPGVLSTFLQHLSCRLLGFAYDFGIFIKILHIYSHSNGIGWKNKSKYNHFKDFIHFSLKRIA